MICIRLNQSSTNITYVYITSCSFSALTITGILSENQAVAVMQVAIRSSCLSLKRDGCSCTFRPCIRSRCRNQRDQQKYPHKTTRNYTVFIRFNQAKVLKACFFHLSCFVLQAFVKTRHVGRICIIISQIRQVNKTCIGWRT